MFKLENTAKLKSALLGLGVSALLATSLVADDHMSVDGAVKYPIKDGKYGPYHVNVKDAKSFPSYNNGREATQNEIDAWNFDVRPDLEDLPMYDTKHGQPIIVDGKKKVAKGSVEWGEELYDAQCGMCHGEFGTGGRGYPTLAGGKKEDLKIQRLNPADENPNPDVALKTIGSYWPYASTLFWYIQESMPFTHPKSLSNSETYAITAFLLSVNEIKVDGEYMDYDFELSKENFHKINLLPNHDGFYPKVDTEDPHQGPKNMQALLSDPTIYGKGTRCMSNCLEDDVENLLMRIEVDLAESVNEPISVERTWKEPESNVASDVDPKLVENYEVYCSACHSNAAIGAPVIGDKAAWDATLEKGIDAVYENAIVGINAMPPMGGSPLSEEDFKAVIDYMIEESK